MRGYFINLERSAKRRDQMLAQAHRFPGALERFDAVDGATLTPGEDSLLSREALGCFLSHFNLISAAPQDDYFCVFEDDVILSDDLSAMLCQNSLEILADFDIIWLDCSINTSQVNLLSLWVSCRKHLETPKDIDDFLSPRRIKGCEVFPALGLYDYGATAYVVTPRGRARLLSLMKEDLDRGPPGPVDALYKQASEDGRLKAAVLAPFLATPRLDSMSSSTIGPRNQVDDELRLIYAIRRMFFAGSIEALPEFVTGLLKSPDRAQTPSQLLTRLSAAAFEFSLTKEGFAIG